MALSGKASFNRREAFGLATASMLGMSAIGVSTPSSGQALDDIDRLNVLLNCEYLQAQFLSYIQSGGGLQAPLLTGEGAAGAVTPGRRVTISDAGLAAAISEMADDQRLRLAPLRGVNGFRSVAQPAMDITPVPFTRAMQLAGVVAAGTTFDPYASDENMLYALHFLKDASVAAYRDVLPLITNRTFMQFTAGALATECQHAATLRSVIYRRGAVTRRYRDNSERLAALRRDLSNGSVEDRGVAATARSYPGSQGTVSLVTANISPATDTADIPARSTGRLLNILYLTREAAARGGFFPNGVNGTLRTSLAA